MKIFKDTAGKIARAEHDLAIVESTIAELRRQRDGMLLDGEVDDIDKLDRQIGDYSRQVSVFRDRIAGLRPRLAQEQADQRKADREKAIAAAEKILPARMAAIDALAQWARDGVTLVERLETASRLKGWPSGLEKPYLDDVRNDRMLRAIAAAFSGLGSDWNPQRAVEIIADAVANEIDHHRSAIDDLRLNPATGTPVEEAA
jgi:hypothetical protein